MKKLLLTLLVIFFYVANSISQKPDLELQIEEWTALIQAGEVRTTEGAFTACFEKKCGCIDSTGNIIIPFKYDFIKGFFNGLAAVNIGGKMTEGYTSFIEGGKWGIINNQGKKVTALKYDYIPAVDNGYFENLIPVELNGKQGLINRKGKEITDLIYDDIERFDDTLWQVSHNDSILNSTDTMNNRIKYWFFDRKGLVGKSGTITPIKYSKIYSPFSDGFTKVEIIYFDDKLNRAGIKQGIINNRGSEVIPPVYDYIDEIKDESGIPDYFSGGLALVQILDKHEKWGYINESGEIIIPVEYLEAGRFINGLAIVAKKGDSTSLGVFGDGREYFQYAPHYGVIDTSENIIIPLKYKSMTSFHKGITKVSLNEKFGYLDRTGKAVIPIKYDYIGENGFSSEKPLVKVNLNEKWGFIDSLGNEVISIQYDKVGYFSEGIVPVKLNSKWQFINNNGKEITPLKYDEASEFREEYAVVKLKNKYGYIDKSGKVVIPIKYDYAYDFSDGKAMVKINENNSDIGGETFYIDKNGNKVE